MLQVVSLNIQLNRHIKRVLPFLKSENIDILCVQEIYECDIDLFKKKLINEPKKYEI
jgi:exonuclease III